MLVPSIILFVMLSFFQPSFINTCMITLWQLAKANLTSTYSSSDTKLFPEKSSFTDTNPNLTDYTLYYILYTVIIYI